MARLPYLDLQDLAPEHQDLLARKANIYRPLANSPNGLRAFVGLGGFIRFKSKLDPRLRELAILQVGYLTRAPYEWSHHVEIGKKFGVSHDDIRALIDEAEGRSSKLEPLAKAVLKATREMTEDFAISDATFAQLRAALGNECTVDLVLTIAFYNGVVCAYWRAWQSMSRTATSAISTSFHSRLRQAKSDMSSKSTTPVPARPAATVVILRDGADGIEVFMVVRHHEIEFASGALVFPGGKVDAEDADAAWAELAPQAPAAPDRSFLVAAVRETFEEAGLVLARRSGAREVLDADTAHKLVEVHRARLLKGETTFVDIVRSERLVLAADLMVPFAHWITPEPVPKRFDTHFFLIAAPMAQIGAHDGGESVEGLWITPQQALRDAEAGTRTLVFATRMNLTKLARYRTVAEAVEVTRSRPVVTVVPKVKRTAGGRTLQIPAEADYGVTEVFVEEGSRFGTLAHRG